MYMKTLLYGKWHRALLVQYMEVSIDQRNAPLNVEYDEKFEWCKFDRFATWCANPQPTLLRCLLFAVRGSHPHILPLLSRGAAPCRGSTTCTTSSCLNSGSNAAKRVSTMLPTSSTKTMMTPFLGTKRCHQPAEHDEHRHAAEDRGASEETRGGARVRELTSPTTPSTMCTSPLAEDSLGWHIAESACSPSIFLLPHLRTLALRIAGSG